MSEALLLVLPQTQMMMTLYRWGIMSVNVCKLWEREYMVGKVFSLSKKMNKFSQQIDMPLIFEKFKINALVCGYT